KERSVGAESFSSMTWHRSGCGRRVFVLIESIRTAFAWLRCAPIAVADVLIGESLLPRFAAGVGCYFLANPGAEHNPNPSGNDRPTDVLVGSMRIDKST